MKGVQYDLEFLGKDNNIIHVKGVNMCHLIRNIRALFVSEYNIPETVYTLNNQIIYNLINKRVTGKLLTNIVTIKRLIT